MTERPAYVDREGRSVGPLKWDRLRADKRYARLAQTIISDDVTTSAVLTMWMGINIEPGPLFETLVVTGRSRRVAGQYETESDAIEGHRNLVDRIAGDLVDLESGRQLKVSHGVNERWDEFVRPTRSRRGAP
jgi:hypothetical protein